MVTLCRLLTLWLETVTLAESLIKTYFWIRLMRLKLIMRTTCNRINTGDKENLKWPKTKNNPQFVPCKRMKCVTSTAEWSFLNIWWFQCSWPPRSHLKRNKVISFHGNCENDLITHLRGDAGGEDTRMQEKSKSLLICHTVAFSALNGSDSLTSRESRRGLRGPRLTRCILGKRSRWPELMKPRESLGKSRRFREKKKYIYLMNPAMSVLCLKWTAPSSSHWLDTLASI